MLATSPSAPRKVAAVTLIFWVMKICATTLGETAGDLLSMTLGVGYGISSLLLIGAFLISLVAQLRARAYHPVLYWSVILTTSTAGTTVSDYMDRTLGLGYATGALILAGLLLTSLAVWYRSEGSLSVSNISSFRPELFYWVTILISNTLGTALGDYLADDSGLGFGGGRAADRFRSCRRSGALLPDGPIPRAAFLAGLRADPSVRGYFRRPPD